MQVIDGVSGNPFFAASQLFDAPSPRPRCDGKRKQATRPPTHAQHMECVRVKSRSRSPNAWERVRKEEERKKKKDHELDAALVPSMI